MTSRAFLAGLRGRLAGSFHACRWPGCDRQLPPEKWGCPEHLHRLPPNLRQRLASAYEIRARTKGAGAAACRLVDREAADWIAEHLANPRDRGRRPGQRELFR